MKTTPDFITHLEPNEVFVFGSNLAGMHGGGAARIAYEKFSAEWGVGFSMSLASVAASPVSKTNRLLPSSPPPVIWRMSPYPKAGDN